MLVQPTPEERDPGVLDDVAVELAENVELGLEDAGALELLVYPLSGSCCVVVPVPVGTSASSLAVEAQAREAGPPGDVFDPFDQPERDRMYGLATTFVHHHARVLVSGSRLRSTNRTHRDGTLVVSERRFRRFPLAVTKVRWAIGRDGSVVDVRDHRVLTGHVRHVALRSRPFLWAPAYGDRYDVPFLLANLCELLHVALPDRVASVGEVASSGPSWIAGTGTHAEERDAAASGGVTDFILPAKSGLLQGRHGALRVWPARDADEAVFSMLAVATGASAVPDLKHRWLLRTVSSWVSLVGVLAGFTVTQASGGLVGDPAALRSLLGVSAGLFALSAFATHRFWSIDR